MIIYPLAKIVHWGLTQKMSIIRSDVLLWVKVDGIEQREVLAKEVFQMGLGSVS